MEAEGTRQTSLSDLKSLGFPSLPSRLKAFAAHTLWLQRAGDYRWRATKASSASLPLFSPPLRPPLIRLFFIFHFSFVPPRFFLALVSV